MHLRNNRVLILLFTFILFSIGMGAQGASPQTPTNQAPAQQPAAIPTDQGQEGPPQQPPPPIHPTQPPAETQPPPSNNQGQQAPSDQGSDQGEAGGFVFKAEVQEV